MSKIIVNSCSNLNEGCKTLDLAHIFITRKCNLHCKHCYTDSCNSNDSILPFIFWKRVANQLRNLKVKHIHVEGGEAFLHPDFDKIISLLIELKFKNILLVTNGVLATKERLRLLKVKGLKKIAISLDSLTREINDDLRPGSYEYTVQSIKHAVELGFHTRISCCLNRKNINDVRSFTDAVYNMGVRTLNYDWFVGVGRGNAVFDEYGITEADKEILCRFENDIYDISTNAKYKNFNLCIDLPDWYANRNSFMSNDVYRTRYLDCDAIRKQVSINEVGNVYPCFIFAYGDKYIGNLNNDFLVDIIKNANFNCLDCPINAKGHIFYKRSF